VRDGVTRRTHEFVEKRTVSPLAKTCLLTLPRPELAPAAAASTKSGDTPPAKVEISGAALGVGVGVEVGDGEGVCDGGMHAAAPPGSTTRTVP
jgi:hypothetical protein